MLMIDFDQAVRRQQIETHFQPIVDLRGGEIVAIEARVSRCGVAGQFFTASDVLRAALVRGICQAAGKSWACAWARKASCAWNSWNFSARPAAMKGKGPLISRPRCLDDLMFLLKQGRCW